MRTSRRMLNGEVLDLDVPDAAALPPSTAISVLSLDGRELELTSGSVSDRDYYLSLSGTRLDQELTLPGGRLLRTGRYGGDPASGLGFSVSVGAHEVYGFTTPGVDLETLAGQLGQVRFVDTDTGPWVEPLAPVDWSAHRAHVVAQVVELSGAGGEGSEQPAGYLLDVRRTRSGAPPVGTGTADGIAVRGGRLSRSAVQERHAYAVLEAADFIAYGIPGGADDLDLVATSMSVVTTRLG